jgi:N-acetylmuramoyl-L-alanine amidase
LGQLWLACVGIFAVLWFTMPPDNFFNLPLHLHKKPAVKADYIVIHCSDTPAFMNIGAQDIDRWHKHKGWQGIGYHYVIRRDGRIEPGRPEHYPGAHTLHYNHRSVGVCLVGGRSTKGRRAQNNFTASQFRSLRQLVDRLKARYPQAAVVGHGQLNHGRACPSFNVSQWIKA